MIHLIVQASKYLMIFLFLVYTFECFHVFFFILMPFLFCILQQKIFS